MPSAKIERDTAAMSRRYSRILNGASTRQPPALATGCWISNCVLTPSMVHDGLRSSPTIFSPRARSGVGECRATALLERLGAFLEIVRHQQLQLALRLALERRIELGQRRRV